MNEGYVKCEIGGSCSGVDEKLIIPGSYAMSTGEYFPTFRKILPFILSVVFSKKSQ